MVKRRRDSYLMQGDNHNVIKKLHSASPKQNMCMVTPLKELLNDLHQPSSVAENYVAKVCDFSESLLKTTTKNAIMHGDLHHDNVIYDESILQKLSVIQFMNIHRL